MIAISVVTHIIVFPWRIFGICVTAVRCRAILITGMVVSGHMNAYLATSLVEEDLRGWCRFVRSIGTLRSARGSACVMWVVGRGSSAGPEIVTILILVTLVPLVSCSMNWVFIFVWKALSSLIIIVVMTVIIFIVIRTWGLGISQVTTVVPDGRVGGQSCLYAWFHCECCGENLLLVNYLVQ